VLGGSYYLYNAGGDRKVAKKEIERTFSFNQPRRSWLTHRHRGCAESNRKTERQRLLCQRSSEGGRSMGTKDRLQDRQHCGLLAEMRSIYADKLAAGRRRS